jgi:hypothetical protein
MKTHRSHYEDEILVLERKAMIMFLAFLGKLEHSVQCEGHPEKEGRAFLKLYQMPHQRYHHE